MLAPSLGADMRRREFITLLGGATVAWPLAARAQPPGRMRRIGVLMPQGESDPVQRSWTTAFATRLQELGWVEGSSVRIDYRWAAGDMARMAALAKELVEQQPDVLLGATVTATQALRQYTLVIPIVFAMVSDPVAAGVVTNLARPEGNITGFTNYEYAMGGKWLEALKECAPALARAAILFDPGSVNWPLFVRAIEAAARSLSVPLVPFPVQSDAEIERALAEFGTKPNGGIIALPTARIVARREKIIALSARHRLPAMYPFRIFVEEGGLMSYGPDVPDQYRGAASYVDRILKGAKPADLPVQQPTRFELVLNLKTAKLLGLTLPPTLLARADEVIE
jgi:putative tryptophan/tyrosine transport system substrate-binding protein